MFAIIVGGGGLYLLKILAHQVRRLGDNWNELYMGVDHRVRYFCCCIERCFSMNKGTVYSVVSKGVDACVEHGKGKVVSLVMNNSLSGFIRVIETVVAGIISIVSTYYFLTTKVKVPVFKEQVRKAEEKIKHIFKAFIRAQMIIMAIDVVVCFVGFTLMKNPYSLLIALVSGFMDALPMIGIGLILIPWILASLVAGTTQNAIVLSVVFVICYTVREVLEPKLIGEGIGLSPIMSLLTLFAGYKLFGIIGLFAGPLVYMIVADNTDKA